MGGGQGGLTNGARGPCAATNSKVACLCLNSFVESRPGILLVFIYLMGISISYEEKAW